MIDRDIVFLSQTDTTVGFLSQNPLRLAEVKKRNPKQPFLVCVDSFKKQKSLVRTPKKFRSKVRRSQKTTFLYPNGKAVRVVKEKIHNQLLKKFDFLYSTSANENKKPFSLHYAQEKADIMIENKKGYHDNPPSPLIKLTRTQKQILR
jgi:tRNA A37 threonylcarbamoyladenosine synthetase subunit TsaC/SUA5/YrdC